MTNGSMQTMITQARKETHDSQLPAAIRDRWYLAKLKGISDQAMADQREEVKAAQSTKIAQGRKDARALLHPETTTARP